MTEMKPVNAAAKSTALARLDGVKVIDVDTHVTEKWDLCQLFLSPRVARHPT